MPPLKLDKWTKEAESLETGKSLLYFKQLVGLTIDKRRLASLEGKSKAHYSRYLQSYVGDVKAPRGPFLMSVSSVGMAVTYKQLLKLHEARATKVVSQEFKFAGSPVNWGSWRQFAASSDDSAGAQGGLRRLHRKVIDPVAP